MNILDVITNGEIDALKSIKKKVEDNKYNVTVLETSRVDWNVSDLIEMILETLIDDY